ncbi:hypothetical protein Tco_0472363 [Tanacetum coccineum]
MYSCELCRNDAHYGYDCPPQVLLNCPAFYDNDDEDDDEEYTIAITPVLPTMEPDNSLSMGDEHLRTILEKKESSVEDLVPIPNHSEIFFDPNDDYASSDDDPLYSEDIDYVDASPPDSELVSLEEVKDFDTEDGEIDTDILLTIKDDILREKLLNINLLIAKIEALKDNPTPSTDSVLKSPSLFPNSFLEETDTSDNFLPESDIFCFDMEEKKKRAFYIGWSKDEEVLFEVVLVSKVEDEKEEKMMLTKKMRTNGLHIKEVVGEAFNLKGDVSLKYNVTIIANMVVMPVNVLSQDKWKKKLILWSNHMTDEEDLYAEMEKSKGSVTFVDESKALVKGKGTILVRAKDGSHQYILDVYNGMVKGLDQIDHPNQVCEVCLLEKHGRSSFSKKVTSRGKEPLQLIHMDLCVSVKEFRQQDSTKNMEGDETYNISSKDIREHILCPCSEPKLKVVVSRDMKLDEGGSWDWSIKENKRYAFLPMIEEEKEEVETRETSEEVQQPPSPSLT